MFIRTGSLLPHLPPYLPPTPHSCAAPAPGPPTTLPHTEREMLTMKLRTPHPRAAPAPGPPTTLPHTEREMLIMKLRTPPGPERTEVLQLAQIFRARVVDVSDNVLTLCVSGDPGKVGARSARGREHACART